MNLTRPQKILLLPLIILLLLLLNAFTIANPPAEVLPEYINWGYLNVQYTGPDYFFYVSYDQADKEVDTLVVGDIIKEYPAQKLVTGHTANSITGEDMPRGYKYVLFDSKVVFDVKVSKVIKGSCSPGDTIKIKQPVLTGSSIIYFKEGERHIFFLQTYGKGIPASPISTLQGDILIMDGKTKRTNNIQFVNDNIPESAAVKALKKRVETVKGKVFENTDKDIKNQHI